jgi:DNA-binding SARP family transcriptional activator/pimeloyl-ACP methyl ester carboxylesterase
MIEARMFGPLAVRLNGGWLGPRDFGGAKPKQLLEILLLERGRAVAKDDLADRLWGAQLPDHVDASVETYVSVVRRRLGDARRLITTEPGGYCLSAQSVSVDLGEFDRLVQWAAAVEPVERRVKLEAAIALAGGEVLADEPYAEWALPVRAQYRERRLQAVVELAECCLALGDPRAAVEHAQESVATDPLLERAYRVLIVGHYVLGDQAEALRAYARCREALAHELGVVPLPETLSLHTAIVRNEPVDDLIGVVAQRTPPVRFANHDGVRLAYQTLGDGPVDLFFVPAFVTHLGLTWDDPTYAGFLRRLASFSRLIVMDKRGVGLSDPMLERPTVEQRSDDLLAVLDDVDCERAVLFGVCEGSLCALAAARHPERVAGLILASSYPRLLRADDYPWGWSQRFFDVFARGFEDVWVCGEGLEHVNRSVVDHPRYRGWYARLRRLASSPGIARHLLDLDAEIDIRSILPKITAPTLILTGAGDAFVRAENGHYLAEHIPNAELIEFARDEHEPWMGDSEPVIEAIRAFVARVAAPEPTAV